MRTDDVNGARCRSDGVWMILARDFIKKQLDSGTVSIHDMISVVLMSEEGRIIFQYEPTDWVLYNKIVQMREWNTEKPKGPGNYVPAIEKAENVLNYNDCGSCSLSLIFFSDGAPSDGQNQLEEIYTKIIRISSRFGRRLVVSCIGVADGKEDFSVLEKMVKEAADFGCRSSFSRPSLSINSLSSIMTSITSSMQSSKTELTELRTGSCRTVRNDVVRERQNVIDNSTGPGDDWRVFQQSDEKRYLNAVFTWNNYIRDFATVLDTRCAGCYIEVADSMTYEIISGARCESCKACYFCPDCYKRAPQLHRCNEMAEKRRNRLIVKHPLPSLSVALKKSAFGEGAERLAFRFRFLDPSGKLFIGPKMVAKESRFVETNEEMDESVEYLQSHRHSYHRVFMRTQATASIFASKYNEALDDLSGVLKSKGFTEKLGNYPRIHFVEPMILELAEVQDDGKAKMHNILVESFIEGSYQKWNNNFGKISHDLNVEDFSQACVSCGVGLDSIAFLLGRKKESLKKSTTAENDDVGHIDSGTGNSTQQRLDTKKTSQFHSLGIIDEEESDEEDSDDEEKTLEDDLSASITNKKCVESQDDFDELIATAADLAPPEGSYRSIPNGYFAQAFSHYSYVRSGGRIMVIDLQGALKINREEGTSKFILTDPAIHKRPKAFKHIFNHQRLDFGRTDRGDKGIFAFFESHVCNDACRLLGLRPWPYAKEVNS